MLTASSAAEALELLSGQHVDVMLADIAMPGEDGYALVRKVRVDGRAGEHDPGGGPDCAGAR